MYTYFLLQSISPEQAKRFTKFRERKGLIEKDVVCIKLTVLFLSLLIECNFSYQLYFDLFLRLGQTDRSPSMTGMIMQM